MATALRQLADHVFDGSVEVGIDVVDVADFERLSPARFERFYRRCFTEREIAYCRAQARPAQHFAARFAAKEAAVKAVAAYTPLAYWQIEVQHQPDGRPTLALWTFDRMAPLHDLDELELRVSLTHAEVWAAAVVVALRRDGADVAQAH
jgi:holo-[acyl-carrier protein] synthase